MRKDNKNQNPANNWRKRVNQGVTGALILTAVGCGKTPEEGIDMRQLAEDAAGHCTQKSTSSDGRGRKTEGGVRVSVPCEMAGDKAAIAAASASAEKQCAAVKPGKTEVFSDVGNGFIAICTVPPQLEISLLNALSLPSAEASSPPPVASGARERVNAKREVASASNTLR